MRSAYAVYGFHKTRAVESMIYGQDYNKRRVSDLLVPVVDSDVDGNGLSSSLRQRRPSRTPESSMAAS
jgi:hypothetical protein